MATRDKITAYIPPDLADSLRRVAAIRDRSISDIVEDAIARSFMNAGREAEHAALMAKLDRVQRRLGVIERSQETLFELCAHGLRFEMSMAPDISETDRPVLNARGAERFSQVVHAIIDRLGAGRGVWRSRFAAELTSESDTRAAGPTDISASAAE